MTESTSNQKIEMSVRARLAGCEVTLSLSVDESELKNRLKAVLEKLGELGIDPMGSERSGEDLQDRDGAGSGAAGDNPLSRLHIETQIEVSTLESLIGVKNDSVQIYRATQYSPSDAVVILCLAYEKGLGHASMSFETFSALLEANHIKMKTPLANLCFNLQRDGKIDKRSYDNGRVIVLTPAGEMRAIEALKAAAGGGKAVRAKRSR